MRKRGLIKFQQINPLPVQTVQSLFHLINKNIWNSLKIQAFFEMSWMSLSKAIRNYSHKASKGDI